MAPDAAALLSRPRPGRGICASRDKFIIYPDHPVARPLTDRPTADGFIRSDKNGFLIRYASSEFRSNLPVELTAKAKRGSTKGLEYNWSALERRDIDALFARIAELASVPPADLA